jgi:hypothetical protein
MRHEKCTHFATQAFGNIRQNYRTFTLATIACSSDNQTIMNSIIPTIVVIVLSKYQFVQHTACWSGYIKSRLNNWLHTLF